MKREKFLWPLTQSHHGALLLAKKVRGKLGTSGLEAQDLEKLKMEVRGFFQRELKVHFADEEELLTLFEAQVGPDDPDSRRVREDHQLLKTWVDQGTQECLGLFAEKITQHVRFEEDVLFGRIEKAFSEAVKTEVGKKLQHLS